MKMKVTSRGVTIPRRMLGEATEVEVRQEEDRIVVSPVVEDGPPPVDDPIWDFGKDPIDLGMTDASVNHDKYLADEAMDDHSS